MNKSLVFIDDFSKEEIYEIFKLADEFAEGVGQVKTLEGKTVVLFFPESSIRTRVTFEKGIQELGGKTILFPPEALDKKEKLGDVIGYLENWVDAIVVRHSDIEVVKSMAKHAKIPVINAMTSENHPCEIIADLYALSKLYKDIEKKKFLFVGAKGNIGNTWKAASELMGFELEQCCPAGIISDVNHHLIVCEVDNKIVASCVCVIIPNLTRTVRPYAFVENVVTHGDYRKKGYATSCLNYAKQVAQENNCYKMMLLTGSKEESTLNFYRNAGYNSSDKTAFIQWIDM